MHRWIIEKQKADTLKIEMLKIYSEEFKEAADKAVPAEDLSGGVDKFLDWLYGQTKALSVLPRTHISK